MRKVKNRYVLMLLACCLFLLPLFYVNVHATSSWPSATTKSYCEFCAEKKINVYRDTACNTRGTSSPAKSYNAYISKNDICYIYKFNYSYLQVSYPTSSGRKTGYIKRADFASETTPKNLFKSKGKVTTYKYPYGAAYGNTASGDAIYELGTRNGYTAIIYTAKSGKRAFKYGFVKNADYKKITTAASTAPKATTTTKGTVTLKVPVYRQYNYPKVYIGTKTIKEIGCTTCCLAMKYSYQTGKATPPDKMKSKLSYSNNSIIWSSVTKHGYTVTGQYNTKITNNIMKLIYTQLKNNKPVIVGGIPSASSTKQHWIIVTGYKGNTTNFSASGFTIIDPNSSSRTALQAFLNYKPYIYRIIY